MSAATQLDHHDSHAEARGITRWLFTTNHKDIGILYMLFGLMMFLLGGFFAELIRAQLIHPANHLLTPELYNQVITPHGLVMVFGALMPVTAGFANYLIPLMIGAPDMALPRLNNWGSCSCRRPQSCSCCLSFCNISALATARSTRGGPSTPRSRCKADWASTSRSSRSSCSASLGAFILGAAQLLLVYNIVMAWRGNGRRASSQVWEGAQGLEFTLPSPPPHHTFTEQPAVS
jgi:heme/copper-type cytochrome/quinol oxidase subunit 1